jgi:hypothetical protein
MRKLTCDLCRDEYLSRTLYDMEFSFPYVVCETCLCRIRLNAGREGFYIDHPFITWLFVGIKWETMDGWVGFAHEKEKNLLTQARKEKKYLDWAKEV